MLSYVISGPISSRSISPEWRVVLEELADKLRHYGESNRLIVSTYENECDFLENINVITNQDPGPDNYSHYSHYSKKREIVRSNVNRMIQSTLNGLKSVNSDWCVKSRIEIIPTLENVSSHIEKLIEVIDILNSRDSRSALFLREHFGGSILTSHGTLCAFPDTFQIMRTHQMREVWSRALHIYEEEKALFSHRVFPLKNEQLIGQAFLQTIYKNDSFRFSERYHYDWRIFTAEYRTMKEIVLLMSTKSMFMPETRISAKKGIEKEEIIRMQNSCPQKHIVRFLINRNLKIWSAKRYWFSKALQKVAKIFQNKL